MLSGISYEDSSTLILVVLLLGVFSAILKPMLVLFALPFVVLTMGIGLLVINALLYMFAGYLVDGFEVASFGYAFMGAFIITMLNLFFNNWINGGKSYSRVNVNRRRSVGSVGPEGGRRQSSAEGRRIDRNDDVIDI